MITTEAMVADRPEPKGDGKVHPLDVKAGDRVLFGKWSGTEVKLVSFSVCLRSGGAALDEAHDVGLLHDHEVLAIAPPRKNRWKARLSPSGRVPAAKVGRPLTS